MGKFDGRVVIVTGGQRGLGAAALREMAQEGATCIVNYPNPSEADIAHALAKDLKEFGVQAEAIAADVTIPDQIDALVETVMKAHGRIDVLVNMPASIRFGHGKISTWRHGKARSRSI